MKKKAMFKGFFKNLLTRILILHSTSEKSQSELSDQKDYITFLNGEKIRLIWNSATIDAINKLAKQENSHLLEGKSTILEIRFILWQMAIEGQKADGKKLKLNEMEFGRLVDLRDHEVVSKVIFKIACPQN